LSRKTHTRAALVTLLAALFASMLAFAGSASGKVRAYRATRVAPSHVTFRVPGVKPSTIRSARVRTRGYRRSVSAHRVRLAVIRRGRVTVGVAGRLSRARREAMRLVLTLHKAHHSASGDARGFCPGDGALFGVGRWPGACWRPYADDSPFNQEVSGSTRDARGSAAMVRKVTGFGDPGNLVAGEAGSGDDWAHPTYYSQAGDPLYAIHCYEEDWGDCSIEGHRIHVPARARPAAGGDAHMTVVDQASGWEYDLYKVRSKSNGRLTIRFGGRTRIDGDGRGSDATAARFGNLAGIIRAQEMAAGRIDHALFMVVECDNGRYVYPAMKSGRSCSDMGRSNSGAPPMGAHFQLDMSDSKIQSLGLPRWKETILEAMAHYGMYVGDTGTDSWGVQLESGQTYTSFGREDAMVAWARSAGVPDYHGHFVMNLADRVNWSRYLRVVAP
jgi:hypothetical protein